MAKWRHKNIYIYFNDIFGSMGENCLPYMPESFTCNINGRNEEMDILHGVGSDEGLAGTMNFVKRPGLKTWSIECFFSHPDRPLYATVNRSHHWTPEFWVEFFESAMYQRKVLEMTVSGLDIVTYVTIENFKHTKEAGEEIDTYYTIEIKEYQFQEIKQEEVNIKQEIPKYDGQNINQQPTVPPLDGNMWLVGRAWKGFSPANGLSSPFVTGKGDNTAMFNWLKVKVIDKRQNPVDTVLLTNDGEQFAEAVYSYVDERAGSYKPQDDVEAQIQKYIPIQVFYDWYKLAITDVLNGTGASHQKHSFPNASKYKKFLNNYLECLLIYIKDTYGDMNNVMTYSQYLRNDRDNRLFFRSMLDNHSWTLIRNSNIGTRNWHSERNGQKILPEIARVRKDINTKFRNDMALANVRGGGTIANIETLEEFSLMHGTGRKDTKGNDYVTGETFPVGTKMWCYGELKKDLWDKNDGKVPFSISTYN